MITEEDVYEGFRTMMTRNLRFYNNDNVIHVGEVSGCLRKAYYARRYGSKELRHLDKQKYIIMGLGITIHNALEEYLRSLGYNTEKSHMLKHNGVILAGTPDAVNHEEVIEIKTVTRIPEAPLQQHVMQLNTYLYMTGASRGSLIYINKRDGTVRIHKITRNENLYRKTLARAEKLYKALKTDTPPEPEPSPLCRFCEWRQLCEKQTRGAGNHVE